MRDKALKVKRPVPATLRSARIDAVMVAPAVATLIAKRRAATTFAAAGERAARSYITGTALATSTHSSQIGIARGELSNDVARRSPRRRRPRAAERTQARQGATWAK